LSLLIAILILVLVAAVVAVVSGPLRAARRDGAGRSPEAARPGEAAPGQVGRDRDGGPAAEAVRSDLEAAREAKYREIRDAELDYRTGKLSTEDYEAIDRGLRAEAIEILNQLEASGR
jgi:hypothetical protein